MASVLITGFEAFGEHETNPSEAVVYLLGDAATGPGVSTAARPVTSARATAGDVPRPAAPGAAPKGTPHRITGLVLPVAFQSSWKPLVEKIEEVRPDVVLALGLAEDRREVTPELVAINYMDARIPDNQGRQPSQTPIEAAGPAAYFSMLPVHRMTSGLRNAGFPAALSYSAGAFVCNYVMYRLLHHAATANPAMRCGFMHLPGGGSPATRLSPQLLAEAVRVAVNVICD